MAILTDEYGAALTDEFGAALTDEGGGLPIGSGYIPKSVQFFAVELEVYQPGSVAQPIALAWGTAPWGALTMLPQTFESSAILRASDVGYRTRASDAEGVQVYPPFLDQAFDIDRHIALEPGQPSTATFGSFRLSNLGQRYDAYVQARNSDSRPVRILLGRKSGDAVRGTLVDPPYASLQPFFGGTAQSWVLSETELEIPLRDATYWADRPIQTAYYSGAGGYGGGPELTGRPIPITRGGTALYPVQNVPLTMVDAVNLVFQYTDGPGSVVTLYEGGAAVFAADGDVPDLYAGTPPAAGHYRTDNARGLVQMGSTPVRALTADVVGFFPVAGDVHTAASLARWVLTETLAQPEDELDLASFDAADAAYPFYAGFYVGNDASGLDVVRHLLGSIGARLVTSRSGKLGVFVLRSIEAGTLPIARLSTANVIGVVPLKLPVSLDPPPYRWRVGYGQINEVQTSDFNGAIDAARKTKIGSAYQYASWSSGEVLTSWRRPSDPAPVGTALLLANDAQEMADALGDLWSGRPGLFEVEVPVDVAAGLDLGDVVALDWPLADLGGGRLVQIVGEQVRSYDASVKLTVLTSTGVGGVAAFVGLLDRVGVEDGTSAPFVPGLIGVVD